MKLNFDVLCTVGAFSRHTISSAKTVITVRSAPAAYSNSTMAPANNGTYYFSMWLIFYYVSSQMDECSLYLPSGGGGKSNVFSSKATRAKSVEPPKRRRRNRFGRKEKSDQTPDEWKMDPGTAFTMRKADVDYAL